MGSIQRSLVAATIQCSYCCHIVAIKILLFAARAEQEGTADGGKGGDGGSRGAPY